MVKTIKCKLLPTPEQVGLLHQTLATYATACNRILTTAKETGIKHKFSLHKLCYHDIKTSTPLTSNYIIRAIARVASAFGKGKRPPHSFKPTSLDLDSRLFTLFDDKKLLSLSTVSGRQKIDIKLGSYQLQWLKNQSPTAATISYDHRRKLFYLNLCIKVQEPQPTGSQPLGIDLGIKRIATTSEGVMYSGRKTNRTRTKYQLTTASLQRKKSTTKGRRTNVWKVLKRLGSRQRLFTKDVNHCISKALVQHAKDHDYYIVLEDLTNIRKSTKRLNKTTRRLVNSWSFYQLQQFIGYKAKALGVKVIYIKPQYTSQSCSGCGCLGSRIKHKFTCIHCNRTMDADVNAAVNIAALGASVNGPKVTLPLSPAISSDKLLTV